MEKISKLRQVIREEIMKEMNLNRMPQGVKFLGTDARALYDAVKKTFKLDDKELGKFEIADDKIDNIISFPNGQHKGLFAAWKKPSSSITINGKTLNSANWKEYQNADDSKRPFYAIKLN